jgi:hypothetical protein
MEQHISKKVKDLTGMKFNKLKVLSFAGKQGRKSLWNCKCDCGEETVIRSDTLQTDSKTCGGPACIMSYQHEYPKPGDRFGKLVAVGFSHTTKKGGGVYWKFKCDCGNESTSRWFQVKNKKLDHCGCLTFKRVVAGHKTHENRIISAVADLLQNYKKNANYRDLEFSLTRDQFHWLTQQECFFCGVLPENKRKSRPRLYVGEQETFVHNGIDRWHSYLGYTVQNCVPCCKTCNYAKRSMSGEDFIKWIVRIANHAKNISIQWVENKKAVEENLLRL